MGCNLKAYRTFQGGKAFGDNFPNEPVRALKVLFQCKQTFLKVLKCRVTLYNVGGNYYL